MVALVFDPWPLWLACWERPELRGRPVVSAHRGRVVHLSPAARRAGVVSGMALAGARTRVEGLEVVEARSAHHATAWEGLLGELHGWTDRLEPLAQGRVLLGLEPTEARQLAQTYGVRAGVAEEAERALLAAFTASEGEVRHVGEGWLERVPVYVLRGFGLSPDNVTRLGWLGVTHTGQLVRWKRSQLRAYLGAEAGCLEALLYGPHKRHVARYRPPVTLCAQYTFEAPALEPCEVEPVLTCLAEQLASQLDDRTAKRLVVQVEAQGLTVSATRVAKASLKSAGSILRLATLALADTKAQALGLSSVTLELAGLHRPSKQVSLWGVRPGVKEAVAAVEARYPRSLMRAEVVNPYALATEHQTRFVYLSNGEEVVREAVAEAHRGEAEPAREPADADVQEPLAAG